MSIRKIGLLLCCLTAGLVTGLSNKSPAQHSGGIKEDTERTRLSERVRLTLPSRIYATSGIECNVYFENVVLVLNRHNYMFDVRCEKGFQLEERWAFTPSAQECGDYPITMEVRGEANELLARGESVVRVGSPQVMPSSPATLLIVGASFVEYSIYPEHILHLSKAEGAMALRLLGSRGAGNMPATGELRHEGYSGWTAEAFATMSGPLSRSGYHHRPGTGSPFLYESAEGVKKLDFGRYIAEFNGGQAPDFVTVDLGGNDVFSATDATIDEIIDHMFVHYDALLDSIRDAGPQTRIGVLASTPPSASQDGFRNYVGTGKQTQWQFHRNIHRLVERKIEHYDNRSREGIYLVPTYLNLDTQSNFPAWASKRNNRTDDVVIRVNNGTHPSVAGYTQMGDSVFSWIMCTDGRIE